jgi:hypothetical protein
VYDQHLDFFVVSPSLFSLLPSLSTPTFSSQSMAAGTSEHANDESTYEKLNDPKAGEPEIDEVTDRIARGLFSVLVTMGSCCAKNSLFSRRRAHHIFAGHLPIIRAPRGNAAEMHREGMLQKWWHGSWTAGCEILTLPLEAQVPSRAVETALLGDRVRFLFLLYFSEMALVLNRRQQCWCCSTGILI